MWYNLKVLVVEDLQRNDLREHLVYGFILEEMLPVEKLVLAKIVLQAPFSNRKPAGFLIGDTYSPFI